MRKLKLAAFAALATSATIAFAEATITGSISTDGVPSKEYSSLARISLSDASAVALKRVPGKVSEAALESEDGFLVYSVEVASREGRQEVLVDAGNGMILQVEGED